MNCQLVCHLQILFSHPGVESDAGKTAKKVVSHKVDTPSVSVKEKTVPKKSPSSSVPPPSIPKSTSFEHALVFNELEESVSTTEAVEEKPLELSGLYQEAHISLICPYRQLCERFLNTLSLPGNNL